MLLDVVERHATRPFLVDVLGGRTWTYRDAHAAALGLARELARRGAGPGARVAVAFDDRPSLALHYLGCLYGGATVVPVPAGLPTRDREELLSLAAPDLVLEEPLRAEPEDGPAVRVDESRLFTITFTSGTTGRQKGVAHTAGSMLSAARAFADAVGYGPATRLLHVLPMTYMAGILNTLLCPFVAGGAAVVARRFDARSYSDFWVPVVEHAVNALWVAPPMLAGLMRLDRDERGAAQARASLRTISVGTAPLSPALRDAFEEQYGVSLLESYGLSEVLFVSTGSPGSPNQRDSAGRLLARVEVRRAEDGELLVRTPFAMAGYLDDAGMPVAAPDWFRTGDLGFVDDAGNLYVTGRKKDLIIRGGVNVSPRAVELALESNASIAHVAVVGVPDELLGEEVVAVVELTERHRLAEIERELVALCRERLPAAAVPTRFIEVDALPLTPTGKVRKAELRATILAASTTETGRRDDGHERHP